MKRRKTNNDYMNKYFGVHFRFFSSTKSNVYLSFKKNVSLENWVDFVCVIRMSINALTSGMLWKKNHAQLNIFRLDSRIINSDVIHIQEAVDIVLPDAHQRTYERWTATVRQTSQMCLCQWDLYQKSANQFERNCKQTSNQRITIELESSNFHSSSAILLNQLP